jgi:hypothetical protein
MIEAAGLRMHADVFAFGDLVRAQTSLSRAEHAYNDLTNAGLVRVPLSTARLDPPDDHAVNVPTIFALINDDRAGSFS